MEKQTVEGKAENSSSESEVRAQRDILKAIFYCLLLVVVLRSFVLEPFRIPSSSMFPTLRVGDHIFVSKFSYGLSVPLTKFEFLTWNNPRRGDVVVFLWPRDESLHYVKRVVGLPGDKIQIKGRELWINDTLVTKTESSSVSLESEQVDKSDPEGNYFSEKLDEVQHLVRFNSTATLGHERREILEVVPPNNYFVMGDNRDDSSDSRSWGFVPRQNIKGKAQFVWLSLDQAGAWNNFKKVRWDRCARLIQ